MKDKLGTIKEKNHWNSIKFIFLNLIIFILLLICPSKLFFWLIRSFNSCIFSINMVSFSGLNFYYGVCAIESSQSVIIVDIKNLVSNASGLQGDSTDNVLAFFIYISFADWLYLFGLYIWEMPLDDFCYGLMITVFLSRPIFLTK